MKKKIIFLTTVVLSLLFSSCGNTNNANNTKVTTPSVNTETSLEENSENQKVNTCTLIVDCRSLIDSIDELDENKRDLVPENGIIFTSDSIEFTQGETLDKVFERTLKNEKIHYEIEKSKAYDSVYVKGIGNIYQLDAGETSGWTYTVNGEYPTTGMNKYSLNKNDVIEFIYVVKFE